MDKLLWIAVVLIVLWIVAALTKAVVGFVLHLLWIVALILLAVWVVKKVF
jgi:hypothetical protein